MNYLLFVYYDDTIQNTEEKTNEIGVQVSDMMSSKEIKFMFGDRHAVFNFSSNLTIDEMGEYIHIIADEIGGFEFFLTPKPRKLYSNFPEDNLNHLLSLKKTKVKKNAPESKEKLKTKNIGGGEKFFDLSELILNFGRQKEVCNLTLDQLLDKIVDQGADSLTEVEKQKLEEYSKSL
jgi:hypothetical protein